MFMMPSKFEPCGLNQMYSLRYGTVPVVRAVGGLEDTVENYDIRNRTGNGFKFAPYPRMRFWKRYTKHYSSMAIRRLGGNCSNGMNDNNSWENAARKYLEAYEYTAGQW